MLIGILGAHGSREEHADILHSLGVQTVLVKTPEDLNGLRGIVLPGGESTSFGRLIEWSGLQDALYTKIKDEKLPAFGTCAGAILLAKTGSEFAMNAIDIEIDRNAYGRQVDSFSEDIFISEIATEISFHALFIRAPQITSVGADAKVLASYRQKPVLVQSTTHPVLAATFHPELTLDARIHHYFLTNFCS